MVTSRNVTNVDIYDRMERLRVEITNQIDRTSRDHKTELADLRRQFETLEAGRLTALEKRMNDFVISQANQDAVLKQNTATLSAKFVIIYSIIGAIFVAFITAYAYRLIVGTTR